MDAITLRFDVIDMAVTNRDAVVRLCGIVNALELRIAALEAANAALTSALDATFSVAQASHLEEGIDPDDGTMPAYVDTEFDKYEQSRVIPHHEDQPETEPELDPDDSNQWEPISADPNDSGNPYLHFEGWGEEDVW